MSAKQTVVQALEVNASLVGALFTDQTDTHLRVFCYYLSGATSEFTVPLDENLDSLHHLFARLDMLGKCTSVILDKAVQGRLYVEQNNRLLSYTLLNTPGAAPLPVGQDVCHLPWRRVWAGGEAEILELRSRGHASRRYAVRSPVNDMEAASIYRSSHAFLRPIVPPRQTLRQVAAPALLIGVLALVLALGGSSIAWWLARDPAPPVTVRARALPPAPVQPVQPEIRAEMLHEHRITGPFSTSELARMAGAGQLPPRALFRVEGAADWVFYNQLHSQPAQP